MHNLFVLYAECYECYKQVLTKQKSGLEIHLIEELDECLADGMN